jgi:Rrf2 family protein
MLSKTFAYALRAVTYVALHGREGKKINLVELSENINVPHHFLGKIMQDLVKNNIVRSLKGPGGGFWADDATQNLSAFEILKVTDGKAILNHCLMGKKNCNSVQPCPLHHDYAACRDTLFDTLRKTSITSLATKVENGEIFLGEGH